jgi:CRP-like cAMP-binding protein
MDTVSHFLSEHPFFHGIQPEHLRELVSCGRDVRFEQGEFLFREGDEAKCFYVMREGRVRVEIHDARQGAVAVQTVERDDVLGWSWLVPPYLWHFDARALRTSLAVALDGDRLRELCERDHSLGYEFLKRIAGLMEQRLQATRLQLLDLYSEPRT